MLGPSLFSDARLVLIRSGQDVKAAALDVLAPYLSAPVDGVTIALHHTGGARGKGVLEAARAGGALEVGCAKLTRPDERLEFVRAEASRAGASITPDAVAALVDAVGSDLRDLAAVTAQLAGDSGGRIDVDLVRAFHRGRAEVSGFAVADHAVAGRNGDALETLRHALAIGVPQVVLADALADGVRTVARVAAAGRVDPFRLATTLGMPPWKVKKAAGQARGWTESGLRTALRVVAELNADVKGEAVNAGYALERAVRAVVAARSGSS